MTKLPLLFTPILLLAACGSPTPAKKADASDTPAASPSTPAEHASVTPEPPVAVAVASIPQAIQGRWGLNAADCTSTKGDAKGLLVIDGTTLRFYESLGTLKNVQERTATRLVGDFDFVGEGVEWQREMTLDVQDDGKTLVRRENGLAAAPGAFRYQRCA